MRQALPKSEQCLAFRCRCCGALPGVQCFDRRRGYSPIYPHAQRFEDLRDLKDEAVAGSSEFRIHPPKFKASLGEKDGRATAGGRAIQKR